MSWPTTRAGVTDPEHYRHIPEQAVRELRAGFAHAYLLGKSARFGETAEQTAQFQNWAKELDAQWGHHPDARLRQMWADLHPVVELWDQHPEYARRITDQLARAHTAGDLADDADIWNTWEQARELTGHAHHGPTGLVLDAHELHPQPVPELTATRNTDRSAVVDPDLRTAVDKTLGAPRTPVDLLDPNQVAEVIADASTLSLEGLAARADAPAAALLPQVSRNLTVVDTVRGALQERLLRQVRDLAAEHAHHADGFTGDAAEDQGRIERLERITTALGVARADALAAGASPSATDRAYRSGRDGGSTLHIEPSEYEQPNHPQAHLFPGRTPDNSRDDAAPTGTRATFSRTQPGGAAIQAAVDATVTADAHTDWDQRSQQHHESRSTQHAVEVAP